MRILKQSSPILVLGAFLLAATGLHAQSFTTSPCPPPKDGDSITRWFGSGEQACELRSATLPLVNGHLNVRSQNGSIDVIGEDRQDIALEARVSAHAASHGETDSLLHAITIETGSVIQAKGPRTDDSHHWSVSYRLRVPHRLAANLNTDNGSVSLNALEGNIRAETTNGSLRLSDLGGDVHATTTNGSIKANLTGSTWQGTGLSATTTNGAVSVSVPRPYAAHLAASTTNGGTSLNAHGANQSHISRRQIDTNFGPGGPTLTFETTNGSVSIQ